MTDSIMNIISQKISREAREGAKCAKIIDEYLGESIRFGRGC